MKQYKVTITPDALDMLNQRLAYLLFVKKSEQAYDAVEEDYYDTLEELSNVAGAIQEPNEPELKSRGLKRLHFLRHKYVMLYWLDGNEAVVVYIFHETEDYLNKLD